jgi:glycosyltransferase involved in cell wall biosynthesis
VTATRPVRLLWLVDSLGAGGAEALAVPFARSVDPSAFKLSVASMIGASGVNADRLRAEGISVTDLGARNLRDRSAFRRLLALLRAEEIDLVHAHLTYSTIWSALASRLTGVASIASLHVAPSATRALRDTVRHRFSVELRDRLMIAMMNRWTTRVIPVSAALGAEYASRGLRKGKTVVVHNGVQLERFRRPREESRETLQREFALDGDLPIVATVSVLRPKKGIEVLLEAVRSVPHARFLIIGDGPKRAEWETLAGSLGVASRVRWAGFRNDVDALLAGCDLFVHPTLDDALPTVLLEAMAAGLPVVASSVGGIPEIVTPGVTGELVPAGDANALARAIHTLLGNEPLLRRMRKDATVQADRFSTAAWMDRLTVVYREALNQTRVSHPVAVRV